MIEGRDNDDQAWLDGFDIKQVPGGFKVIGPEKEYGTYETVDEAFKNLVQDWKSWCNKKFPTDWHSITETPPDELVEVIDSEGRTAFAYPGWFPFRTIPNPNSNAPWASTIVPCEPYWDGSWFIRCFGLEVHSIGAIVGWKPIPNSTPEPFVL